MRQVLDGWEGGVPIGGKQLQIFCTLTIQHWLLKCNGNAKIITQTTCNQSVVLRPRNK